MYSEKISSSQFIPQELQIVWDFFVWSFSAFQTKKNLTKFQHILNVLQYLAWKACSVTYGLAGHVRGEISVEEVFSSCGHTRHKHGPWGGALLRLGEANTPSA